MSAGHDRAEAQDVNVSFCCDRVVLTAPVSTRLEHDRPNWFLSFESPIRSIAVISMRK